MWTYLQKSGEMLDPTGKLLTTGYSGFGLGKNEPQMEILHDVGPIPAGTYTILPPADSPTHGPFAMHLEPDPGNDMFDRSGFLIHGDSKEHPGLASQGCIILGRPFREAIWASGDHELQVMASGDNHEAVSRAILGED
jgi:hypothetical protein